MNAPDTIDPMVSPVAGGGNPARCWWLGENLLITMALAALVILPLAESLLRATLHVGIAGSNSIVQHLTLAVGMLGGALAARENRLLSLSVAAAFLKGHWKSGAQLFGHAFSAAITTLLAIASLQFVWAEKAGGRLWVYGIPLWLVQMIMPIGFAIVAARLIRHASDNWRGRAVAMVFAAAVILAGAWLPVPAQSLVVPGLVGLLIATILGAPIFVALGGTALILFYGKELPIASIPVDHYRLVVNPTLPTIPLFTLAGYFLAEGGASRRLIRVCQTWVGHVRGGPALATALVCAFFTSFTGASGVTILALGGLLLPVLLAAKYSEKTALGLLTGAGSLGLLLPPCLPVILYAIIAQVPIKDMFLGGLVPGMLLVGLTCGWGILQAPKAREIATQFDSGEATQAVWEAKWELLIPVVALAALFGGFATPVEAAALTALYAFVIEAFVYRDLNVVRDAPRVMTECGLLVGGVLLILGVALGLTNYLVDAGIPDRIIEWVKGSIESRWLFLLALNLFLLIVGCLMDIFSAIVVVVPLIVPIGLAYGIDPVHLGIIFLANLELGYLTPPVGMNLFLSSYRFGKPISEVTRATLPMLGVFLIGVLLITYLPFLTTALPNWFK